jgi:hypothetical protein
VEKNRTGRTVGGVLIERVVGDQYEFLADLCVAQTLPARVPGLLVGYVGWPAIATKSVRRARVDCNELKGIHDAIVRGRVCID